METMLTLRENLKRVSIMPFIWSIISLSSQKYSLSMTAICIACILLAIIISYIYVKSIWKRKHIYKILSNARYLSCIFVSNLLFVSLSIGVFNDIVSFFILLAVAFILNILFILYDIRLKKQCHE